MKTLTQIAIYAAITYMVIAGIGSARNRGYIEGCRDTRESMIEIIKAWEIGDARVDLLGEHLAEGGVI